MINKVNIKDYGIISLFISIIHQFSFEKIEAAISRTSVSLSSFRFFNNFFIESFSFGT